MAGAYFMTSRNGFRALGGILALVLSTTFMSTAGWAGTFGRVVPIGGYAADIALDERRGVLYIANFTANRIEVLDTSDLSIARSINVNAQPGSIALSPNGAYLVIGHYGNNAGTVPATTPKKRFVSSAFVRRAPKSACCSGGGGESDANSCASPYSPRVSAFRVRS